MFTESDLVQFKEKGIDLQDIRIQLENFKKDFPHLLIHRAATAGYGIIQIPKKDLEYYIQRYSKFLTKGRIVKFVPASGAATRMFKTLFEFLSSCRKDNNCEDLIRKDRYKSVRQFFDNIESFAFFPDIKLAFERRGENIKVLLKNGQYVKILNLLLSPEGLNYGKSPKALIKFHTYEDFSRTSLEEHLVEGAKYCRDINGNARLVFTVSTEHKNVFINYIKQVKDKYSKLFNIKYIISFVEQKPSTDTIAVDLDNNPFRDKEGKILFRPGGHGALLDNLNELDTDLIFIKNIDNVAPDLYKSETILYKKVLAGYLLNLQNKVFNYISIINSEKKATNSLVNEIITFLKNELFFTPPTGFELWPNTSKMDLIFNRLQRPIRICGMVKNEGEPGGGPFWIINKDGSISLQIAESSQIDLSKEDQKKHFNSSTHFNPVDLVCGIKDHAGNKFDLLNFRDPQTGFISKKSKEGKDLRAQELPGLWNGAMAGWNTIFIEVPKITFNPVKIINDLLRKEHQSRS